MDNPGKEINVDIDEERLWTLFTTTIPTIESRLEGLEQKLTLACTIMFVLVAGGFSVLGVLIGIR